MLTSFNQFANRQGANSGKQASITPPVTVHPDAFSENVRKKLYLMADVVIDDILPSGWTQERLQFFAKEIRRADYEKADSKGALLACAYELFEEFTIHSTMLEWNRAGDAFSGNYCMSRSLQTYQGDQNLGPYQSVTVDFYFEVTNDQVYLNRFTIKTNHLNSQQGNMIKTTLIITRNGIVLFVEDAKTNRYIRTEAKVQNTIRHNAQSAKPAEMAQAEH